MAVTPATPVAAVLLAVELPCLSKPRSDSGSLASAAWGAGRRYILGLGPLFPVPQHAIFIGPQGLGCVDRGLLAGLLSSLLFYGVYGAEWTVSMNLGRYPLDVGVAGASAGYSSAGRTDFLAGAGRGRRSTP